MLQDRKYFGMTIQQIGILAGLGVLVCLLFSVAGFLFWGKGLSGLSRAPQIASTISSTSTMVITPTISLTETPTPVPYDQLIPDGWTQHKTGLVEIWLPANFKNAAPGVASGVAGNSVVLELGLVLSSKSSYPTTASVSYEPLTSNTLEDFIDLKLSNIPPEINMAERRKVFINSAEAYRLMFEGHTGNNLSTEDLLFVIQDGGVVWYVKYSAEIAAFYESLPDFERSIKTFRIVR